MLIIYAISDVVAEQMSVASLGKAYGRVSIAKSFCDEAKKTAAEGWIEQSAEKTRFLVF